MPEGDVLLNFIGDTSGLVPVENALDSIIDKNEEVGAAWKTTSETMNAQTKTSVDSTNKLAQSIDQLATATKSMDKSVIGGAYKNYIQQIQQQLGLTNKELVSYIQNARTSAQQAIFASKSQEEIDQLTVSIQVMNDQLQKMGVQEDTNAGKHQNFTTQIRALKNEIESLTLAEKENPDITGQTAQRIDELTAKYSEVQRIQRQFQIKSEGLVANNEVIAGTISLVSGLAGGYAVAQGAAALFGSQNDEVQKALLKVNAAMSILQGLQQVTAVLQKSSAASILLDKIARTGQTAAIVENTVATQANVATQTEAIATSEGLAAAEGAQAAATDVATASTEALNTALEINPVILVLTGVLALVAAIAAFSDANTFAEKTQLDVNKALENATELLNADLKAQENATNLIIANAKKRGASETEISALEGQAGNKRLALIDDERNSLTKLYNEQVTEINKVQALGIEVDKETLEATQKLYDKKLELDKQYNDEYASLRVKRSELDKQLDEEAFKSFVGFQQERIANTRAGSDQEKSTQISVIRAIAQEREKTADFIALTDGEKAQKRAEDEKQIQGLELANYQHYLKGRTSLYDSYVADAKLQIIKNQTDTIASINKVTDLEIAALKKRRDEAIKSDPNLNSGETRKIVEETNLQIAELEKQQEVKILDIQKSGINAQLILSKKGTQEEYDFKISLLNKQQQIELAATQLTAQQTAEINAKYLKQREDALKAFNIVQLQNQISILNSELDQFGLNENEKLSITLQRLEEQRSVEILQAEENGAKIVEINAKYDKQIRDQRLATNKSILDDQLKQIEVYSAQAKAFDEKILSQDNSTLQQRINASNEILRIELLSLNSEEDFYKNSLANKLIDQHQYNLAVQDIENKRAAATISNEERITAAFRKEIDIRISYLQSVFNVFQKGLEATLGTTGLSVALAGIQNFGVAAKSIFDNLQVSVKEFNAILNNPDASDDEKSAARISKHKVEIDSYKAVAIAAIATTQDVVNQIFADSAAARQQSLADEITSLENQKAQELSVKNLTEQQKADVDKKYAEKEKQEKIRAFEADKQAKVEQAEINAALAITQAFASNPFPYDLIVAGIVAAATLIQVSKIKSAQPPRFKHGEIDIQGPGTSTSDSIPAMISKGESVIKADSTAKWKEALKAINNDSFEHYIKNNFIYPQVPEYVTPTTTAPGIDYKLLAKEVAAELKGVIPAPAKVEIINDHNGQRHFITTTQGRTEYKNKRYSMK